jgi:hypothetical protein
MPSGRKSTMRTKLAPTNTSQNSSFLERKSRIHTNTAEPTKGPSTVPVPPKRVMMSTVPDIVQWMFSMGTNSRVMVRSAPASPEKRPDRAKATSFTRRVSYPQA